MKKYLLGLFAVCSVCHVLSQSAACVTFPAGPNDFNNATTYPAGSILFTDAGIDFIKPSIVPGIFPPSPGFQYINNTPDEIFFINQMDLDLSSISYTCKKLSFDLIYNGFAVDNDTVFLGSFSLPVLPYVGVGFSVDTLLGGTYVVTGDFNQIHIFGSTTVLSNVCVQECTTASCFDFPASTTENFNDNLAYPAGSVMLSSNGIELIKPVVGFGIYPASGFQYINLNSNEFFFINQLDINLTALTFTCRELTFDLIYNGFAVDNDTIFEGSFAMPVFPYTGSGFTVDTLTGGTYIVSGNFDVIHIFGSTSILSNICVNECAASSCFDFPSTTTENFNDNTAYPAGSVLLSSGNIDLVKPTASFGIYPMSGFQYINVNSTQFMFINQLDIDVSAVAYACKKLTFDLMYNGFAVDADTIFYGSYAMPILPYSGIGFTVDTLTGGTFVITGDFDIVHIFGSTSILSNLCVEPCSTLGFNELSKIGEIYPNPTTDLATIQFANAKVRVVNIYEMSGRKVLSSVSLENFFTADLTNQLKGIYLIEIISDEHREVYQLVKN